MNSDEVKKAAKELVTKDGAVYVLATVDAENGPQMRYMGALVFEGDFEVLMVSSSTARKVEQIAQNPRAQLLFASEDYKRVATLSGTATMDAPDYAISRLYGDYSYKKFPGAGNINLMCEVQILVGEDGIIGGFNIMRDTMGARIDSRCREVLSGD